MKKNDSGESRNDKLFYFGKNLGQNFFTLLLKCIENDMYQSQIAKYLSKKTGKKVSKQRVFYWLRILLRHGLIRKDQQKPILTEQGKKVLIHGENPSNYSGHAFEVSYPIISIGTLPENNVKLKNWGYWKDRFFDINIRVNRGKISKLVIYAPEVKSDSKHDLLMKLGEKLGLILTLIERQYQCKVDWEGRQIVRRLEVHVPNDPEGKIFERDKINFKGKCIDINQSGEGHFDITEGDKSLDPFEAIERYDRMIMNYPSIEKTLGSVALSQTRMLNIEALTGETLKQIKDFLGRIIVDQQSILNLFAINTETMKNVAKFIQQGLERSGGMIPSPSPSKPQEAPKELKYGHFERESKESDLVHLEIMDFVPSFVAELNGQLRDYPDLNRGTRIWLERSVAEVLIRNGKARKLVNW